MGQELDRRSCAQIRTADTDYQQDIGILLNLLRRFFDAGPVNRNALGFVFPKVHVDADFVFFFLEIGTDMCLLLVEIYDILILCAIFNDEQIVNIEERTSSTEWLTRL